MALPANGTPWPPKQMVHLLQDISTWAAWYSGDPDELTTAYGAVAAAGPIERVRPGQFAGGVVGKVSRWFWGQPTSTGHQRTKLHVPVAADIATGSADLLFAEQPQIVTPDDAKDKRARLDQILEGIRWESLLPEAGETSAALSGVYLRIVWDETVAAHPLITVVQPDAAWPEFSFGRLTAVTFWHVVAVNGSTVVRHLERHESGRVVHGLYEGNSSSLGRQVSLTEHPATRDITVDAESAVATGTPRLTAAFIPNVRPVRRSSWRKDPIGSNLGRSDFDGIEGPMDALDEVYTSWMRDVRLGKARIIADQTALESNGRGQGATFDLDRELLVGLNLMGDGGDTAPITAQQFDIRAADHEATINSLLRRIVGGAGYSLQTFDIDASGGAVTATEVVSRDRKSMTTREKKSRYWTPELVHILNTLLEVDAAKFSGKGPIEGLTVEFPASSQPSIVELATSAQLLHAAQSASTETRVRLVHPDWADPDVKAEVDRILAENSLTIPDFGPPGGVPPEGDPVPSDVDGE